MRDAGALSRGQNGALFTLSRADGRKAGQLRPVRITRRFTKHAPGSVLIQCGDTHVLCTACFEVGVPKWRAGSGAGWCTAEYDMLPGSTHQRRSRNRQRLDGRTQEIQRLIGRSLRSVLDLSALGENTILIDCDVLQADGGTRTASVTGAFVALYDAIRAARKQRLITGSPIQDNVAAVSTGMTGRQVLLDLSYEEDVRAGVDFNVVMTGRGRLVEVQGTAEGQTFDRKDLDRMLSRASAGIRELVVAQNRALRRRGGA